MTSLEGLVTVIGMALITLLTRGFFLFPEREVPLPAWFKVGLRYAPLATMAAIVVPEVVMTATGAPDSTARPSAKNPPTRSSMRTCSRIRLIVSGSAAASASTTASLDPPWTLTTP